jgi:hypothetical protein
MKTDIKELMHLEGKHQYQRGWTHACLLWIATMAALATAIFTA